jgi:hypothetical protein
MTDRCFYGPSMGSVGISRPKVRLLKIEVETCALVVRE